jgi:hypothetical protein
MEKSDVGEKWQNRWMDEWMDGGGMDGGVGQWMALWRRLPGVAGRTTGIVDLILSG